MAGPVEEGGKVVSGFFEALKGQPAVLALSIANFALLAFIFYALSGAAKFREQLMTQVFQNTSRIHDMMQQRSTACPPCPRAEIEPPLKSTEVIIEPLKPVEQP